MYVCVCVYVYVYMCVPVSVSVDVCVYAYMHVYMSPDTLKFRSGSGVRAPASEKYIPGPCNLQSPMIFRHV